MIINLKKDNDNNKELI